MVPSQFVILENLPKTPNGKIDRKGLPDPARSAVRGRGPQNEAEEMLAAIWAQVLHLEQVGVEENFFDLGGHSLLATQVMSRVRQIFGVELQLRSLLENPTVAGLAVQLDKATRTMAPPCGRFLQSNVCDCLLPRSVYGSSLAMTRKQVSKRACGFAAKGNLKQGGLACQLAGDCCPP